MAGNALQSLICLPSGHASCKIPSQKTKRTHHVQVSKTRRGVRLFAFFSSILPTLMETIAEK